MDKIFKLSERINFLPVVHGSGSFAREIRNRILSEKLDCLAIALPPEFQTSIEDGIDLLPQITISTQQEDGGEINYVPIDPGQPFIAGLRVAKQEGITRRFIDWSTDNYETRHINFPDTFSLQKLSYEKFSSGILLTLKQPKFETQHYNRACWMAYQLHCLELEYSKILFLCSILDWPWIKTSFDERRKYKIPTKNSRLPILKRVHKSTLFFTLS